MFTTTTTAPGSLPVGWPVCLANPFDPRVSHSAITVDPAVALVADPAAAEQHAAGLVPVELTDTVLADGRRSMARVGDVIWVPADSLR